MGDHHIRPRAMARFGVVASIAAVVLALLTPMLSGASEWAPPSAVYFPETGHHLADDFLTFWRNHGKAPILGRPISERHTDGNIEVQYFERARLEYHSDEPEGQRLVLSQLGREAAAARIAARSRLRGHAYLVPEPGADAIADPFERLYVSPYPADSDDHRYFPESGHTVSNSFKLAWENNGGLAVFGYPISEELRESSPIDGQVYTTQYFERARFEYHPETVANYSVVLTPLGLAAAAARGIDLATTARKDGVRDYSEVLFSPPTPTPAAVGVQRPANVPAGRKWIDVNLSRQYLTALEGDTVVWRGYISSGKRGHETPVGTFSIFSKVRSEDMRGPDPDLPGGRYFQPDVPFVMYFAGGGYAIHGVYWHSNFGTPMSHGCVGAPVGGAGFLYDWAPLGTLVVIHY